MSAALTEIVIESTDPHRAASFWSQALGWPLREYDPGKVPWISATGDPDGHDLKLVFVPALEGRPAGNRLYVNPVGCEMEEEIERLASLGARRGAEGANTPWVAMVDPGGTGLSVLPSRID